MDEETRLPTPPTNRSCQVRKLVIPQASRENTGRGQRTAWVLVQPREIPQLVNPRLSFPLQTMAHGHGDGAGIHEEGDE